MIQCPPGARLVPLSKGQYAIVDEADFDLVSRWSWFCDHKGYPARNIAAEGKRRCTLLMHRFLTGASSNQEVDHVNMVRYDNRRANMRLCDAFENAHNRSKYKTNKSGFKGVCWNKHNKCWQAQIGFKGQGINLGYFSTPEDGAVAYDLAAVSLHGPAFSRLNFPTPSSEDGRAVEFAEARRPPKARALLAANSQTSVRSLARQDLDSQKRSDE